MARELQPTWLLVENVPGLLSSNGGRDFAIVLDELGAAGYFVEWRVLDSRWFGVPQRRRRVFLVGHLGGPSPVPVLFEPEGSGGHPAAGNEAGQDVADVAGVSVAKPLGAKRGFRLDLDHDTYIPEVHGALTRRDGKGPRIDIAEPGFIAHTLRASGFDASEDGTGRGTPLVTTHTLTRSHGVTEDGAGRGTPLVAAPLTSGGHPKSVRRLTPTECERLQGFPDGFTCLEDGEYATDTCKCSDGPRYAALGNAVTVNVAYWVGQRIVAAEAVSA